MGLNKGTHYLLVEEGHVGWNPEAKLLVAVGCDSHDDIA